MTLVFSLDSFRRRGMRLLDRASIVRGCFLLRDGSSRILSKLLIVSSLISREGILCYFSRLFGTRVEFTTGEAESATCFLDVMPNTIRSS
jgi:hypothetical protein